MNKAIYVTSDLIIVTRFVGVPRVFEKIEEGMKAAGAKSGLKKKVLR